MSTLADDLKNVQEFILEQLVEIKATQQALMEILDAFNIIDLQLVEDRIGELEQEILLEYTQREVDDEADEDPDDDDDLGGRLYR